MVEGFAKLVGYSREVNNNMTTSLGKIQTNDEALKNWAQANGLDLKYLKKP